MLFIALYISLVYENGHKNSVFAPEKLKIKLMKLDRARKSKKQEKPLKLIADLIGVYYVILKHLQKTKQIRYSMFKECSIENPEIKAELDVATNDVVKYGANMEETKINYITSKQILADITHGVTDAMKDIQKHGLSNKIKSLGGILADSVSDLIKGDGIAMTGINTKLDKKVDDCVFLKGEKYESGYLNVIYDIFKTP